MRRLILEKWNAGTIKISGIDYRHHADAIANRDRLPDGLRFPPSGRPAKPSTLAAGFQWYVASVSLAGLVSRPRARAEAEWKKAMTPHAAPALPRVNPDPTARLVGLSMIALSLTALWWLLA